MSALADRYEPAAREEANALIGMRALAEAMLAGKSFDLAPVERYLKAQVEMRDLLKAIAICRATTMSEVLSKAHIVQDRLGTPIEEAATARFVREDMEEIEPGPMTLALFLAADVLRMGADMKGR